MGGDYQKGMYNQLMDVMQKLESMEAEHKKDRQETNRLNAEVCSLRKENGELRGKVESLQKEVAEPTSEKCRT